MKLRILTWNTFYYFKLWLSSRSSSETLIFNFSADLSRLSYFNLFVWFNMWYLLVRLSHSNLREFLNLLCETTLFHHVILPYLGLWVSLISTMCDSSILTCKILLFLPVRLLCNFNLPAPLFQPVRLYPYLNLWGSYIPQDSFYFNLRDSLISTCESSFFQPARLSYFNLWNSTYPNVQDFLISICETSLIETCHTAIFQPWDSFIPTCETLLFNF